MRTSPQFRADPIGKFVDPAAMFAARSGGVKTKELLRRAYAGEYPPATPYDYLVDGRLRRLPCNKCSAAMPIWTGS
jgi:hypothetical protein